VGEVRVAYVAFEQLRADAPRLSAKIASIDQKPSHGSPSTGISQSNA